MSVQLVVMGIDPGNGCTAISVLRSGDEIAETRAVKSKLEGPARWIEIEENLRECLAKHGPLLVCIESYAFNTNKGNTQAELGGVIRRRIFKDGYKYFEVNPEKVKKFIGCREKEFIIKEVYKRWGVEFDTHDETDAYVLARIAQAIALLLNDPSSFDPTDYTKAQKEVIESLLNPPEPKKKKTKKK